MADAVDNDTLVAVQNAWAADQETLPQLVSKAPQTGRLKQPQPLPGKGCYAELACELESRELGGVLGGWHDKRKVTIKVRGALADVTAALAAVMGVFNLRTVLVYPNTDPATGLPRFLQYWPLDGGGLKQDETTKAGTDVWIGTATGRVWSVREN